MTNDLFAGVSSFAQLAARLTTFRENHFPPELWKAAALACTFNRDLYGRLAATAPPFSQFVRQSDFSLLAPAAESYCLRDAARERILLAEKENLSTLQSISLRILRYAIEHHDSFEELAQRAVVAPHDGEVLFDRLFSEADEAFDLGRCEALLALLRGRFALLGPRLQKKVAAGAVPVGTLAVSPGLLSQRLIPQSKGSSRHVPDLHPGSKTEARQQMAPQHSRQGRRRQDHLLALGDLAMLHPGELGPADAGRAP